MKPQWILPLHEDDHDKGWHHQCVKIKYKPIYVQPSLSNKHPNKWEVHVNQGITPLDNWISDTYYYDTREEAMVMAEMFAMHDETS